MIRSIDELVLLLVRRVVCGSFFSRPAGLWSHYCKFQENQSINPQSLRCDEVWCKRTRKPDCIAFYSNFFTSLILVLVNSDIGNSIETRIETIEMGTVGCGL